LEFVFEILKESEERYTMADQASSLWEGVKKSADLLISSRGCSVKKSEIFHLVRWRM